MNYQHEIELLEDVALPGFPSVSCKFGLSEDEFMDSDDLAPSHPHSQSTAIENQPFTESNLVPVPTASMKQEFRRRHVPHAWLHKLVHTAFAPNLIISIPGPRTSSLIITHDILLLPYYLHASADF